MTKLTRVYTGERWRKEAELLDVQESEAVVRMPSGELMRDVKVAVTPATYDLIKAGHICANCFEPHAVPFPEACDALKLPDGTVVGCGYRMRERQLYDLEHRWGASQEVRIGSRLSRADEIERLRELDDFEARTGIILPNSVKFPNEVIPH